MGLAQLPLAEPVAGLAADYEALRHGVGSHVIERDVFRIWGPDAETYLQGQCSQDIPPLASGEGADALLLSPAGKLDCLIRVVRSGGDDLVIDVEGGFGGRAIERLTRFKLRSKFEIEPLGWSCVALRGSKVIESSDLAKSVSARFVLPVRWGSWEGLDLLGPPEEIVVPGSVRNCGEDAWEACRIESGMPSMRSELDESVIPAEAGLVERAASMTKGCYTGQELVARIDSRGSRSARQLRGLVFTGLDGDLKAEDFVGAELSVPDRDRPVGRVTSAAWCPGVDAV